MKIKVVDKQTIKEVDLKKMREDAGLSLKQVEELTGIAFTYIFIVERGDIKLIGKTIWDKLKKAYAKKAKN